MPSNHTSAAATASGPADPTPMAPPAFPGRAVTGVCMVIAPIALVVLCLLATDIYKFKGHDFLSAMAANPTRTEIFLNLVPVAIIMLMLAVVGLATMLVATSSKLARFGGVATLAGLCGPLFFLAIEFCGYQMASANDLAAGAHMYDLANTVPGNLINFSGPLLIAGAITLAVAARRSGLLGRFRSVCLGFTALLPIGFIAGFLPISAVGFVGCSIALVPVGAALLRREPLRAAAVAVAPVEQSVGVAASLR